MHLSLLSVSILSLLQHRINHELDNLLISPNFVFVLLCMKFILQNLHIQTVTNDIALLMLTIAAFMYFLTFTLALKIQRENAFRTLKRKSVKRTSKTVSMKLTFVCNIIAKYSDSTCFCLVFNCCQVGCHCEFYFQIDNQFYLSDIGL